MENSQYKCYICNQRFSDCKTVIAHLKCVHMVKEKVSVLKCIKFYKCNKTFVTFAGLRNHLTKCILTENEFEHMVIKFISSF